MDICLAVMLEEPLIDGGMAAVQGCPHSNLPKYYLFQIKSYELLFSPGYKTPEEIT